MYPLKFKPYLKFYPYGGRRFGEVLNLDVPRDCDIAETWEIADHGEEQSTVVNGEHKGKTLRQLMTQFKSELVGECVTSQQSLGQHTSCRLTGEPFGRPFGSDEG